MTVKYVFRIHKSRLPEDQPFPFFVTVTSDATSRLERIVVRGIVEYEEAESIVADLRYAMQDDADREAAARQIVDPHSPFTPRPIERLANGDFRFISRCPLDPKQRR